jgi:gamma-glutamylcyclotransferase (GGCT)/AIG2-like uncharacterized protein YtfP
MDMTAVAVVVIGVALLITSIVAFNKESGEKKPGSGLAGAVFANMNDLFQPGAKQAIEVVQEQRERTIALPAAESHEVNALATYGSLGPGKPNHHHVSDIPGAWIDGIVRGTLHEVGWGAAMGFPALELSENGNDVEVEVLISSELSAHLERLDEFEGIEYTRVIANVETQAGLIPAWVYVRNI